MESNSSIYEPLDENAGLNCWHKTFVSMCWCLASKPYTDWEVSVTNLTARSTPWECGGKSGKLIFSPVNNEFCNSSSEKSSVSGGSQTPFTDKSIKSVQCTTLKLILGSFKIFSWLASLFWKNIKNNLSLIFKCYMFCFNNIWWNQM